MKFLLLPKITDIASVCTIPKEYIQRLKTMIYNFIWGGQNDRIKRTDLCKEYSKGGLAMIDIDQYLNSIQISWLKRLTTSTPMINSWKIIPLSYFKKNGPDFLIFIANMDNFNCLCGKKYVSPFYAELIKTWIICNKKNIKEPKQYSQVRKQIIWGNKFIKYKRKSLMIKNLINSGIIFINDIMFQIKREKYVI